MSKNQVGPIGRQPNKHARKRDALHQKDRRAAAGFLQSGKYDQAERRLEALIGDGDQSAETLHLLGLAKVHKGRRQEGLSMIERSILQAPDAAWMRVNRAAVHQGAGEHARAVSDLEIAVKLQPDSVEAWSNLAASHSILGDRQAAAEAARRAVALAPANANALTAYGNTLMQTDDCATAVEMYERALAIAPNSLSTRLSRYRALERLGSADQLPAETAEIARLLGARVADAAALKADPGAFDRAIAASVDNAAAPAAIIAMALATLGQYEDSLNYAEKACNHAPNDAHAWASQGIALFRLDQPEAAIEPFERTLELRPGWAEIRGALGNALWQAERFEDAVAVLERAVAQAPDASSIWASLGAARRDLRDVAGAEAAYAKALELAPTSGKVALSMALTQFRLKKFTEGAATYRRRWETDGFADQVRPHKHTPWEGSDLEGKKILVYAEQGVGDEVMYASFLQRLIDQGAAVFLEANARMARLFRRSFPAISIGQSQNPALPAFRSDDFDFQCAGGDLMQLVAPTYEDLRPRGAYLKPDPEQVQALRRKYRAGGTDLLVGIAWQSGNPVTGRARTAELNLWAPILELPGVRFVNLQYGDVAEDIMLAEQTFGASILQDPDLDAMRDLDGFAAQVAALDLVVSIDNSTVHFAGALGVPTLMLLNYEPDWRWFGADAGNPWYESVAHVRQEEPGVWGPVIEAAATVIETMATTGQPPVASAPLAPAMVNRGAKPTALLLNDTVAWYHWGCTATSLALRQGIRDKGYALTSAPIPAVYQARPAPVLRADFDDDAFFDAFIAANPALMRQMAEADRIVVNGEGTLHGLAENVRGLLYLIHVAATRLGKPVQIINHSCYPEDRAAITDAITNGLYRKVYRSVEYAAFREHVSLNLMQKIGVEGALSFDSLPLTAKRLLPGLPKPSGKRLVIAGSASADDGTAAAFAEYARWASGQGWSVTLLNGARAFTAADETRFLEAVARFGMPSGTELRVARSLEEWMGTIASASLVATGRFHHTIAAFSLGAPFVAATSNTPKTNALLQLLEKPAPLNIRDPALARNLMTAHVAALDTIEAPALHAARLDAVETLAMENFARL